jgi:ADP-heptose:LPS heptosyltransferase
MSGRADTVLIYRALGLGDLLTALPALRALRRAFPQERLVLAARAGMGPLALHTGAVDDALVVRELAPVPWRRPPPEVGINLHGKGPQSHRVTLATHPVRLLSFRHDAVPNSASGPEWREGEREVDRWCRLVHAFGIPAQPTELDLSAPPGAPSEAHGATLVHPGAAYPARRWPAERWAAVARAEHEQGRRVLITGRADELTLAELVGRGAGLPAASVYAGRTDVIELAALVGAAGRVVCGDTGVAHLATALGTPSVVLFGPTSPAIWGPPSDRPQHRVLWAGGTGDPRGCTVHEGLLQLHVTDVLAALRELDNGPCERQLARLGGEG